MSLLNLIPYLMFIHWLGDFVLQTNQMAQNKSTSWKWLSAHILTYGATLLLGLLPVGFLMQGPLTLSTLFYLILIFGYYALVNAGLHFIIDAITSRITSRLWKEQKVHEFFVVIGIDQFLHFICLYYTAWLFFR